MPEPFDLTIYSVIDGAKTPLVVKAYPTASPYLAVHLSDAVYNVDPPPCEMWTITHRVTGLALLKNAPSYGLALLLANRVAGFRSCNWSRALPAKRMPAAAVRAERAFNSILAQIEKLYFRLSGTQVLP
jgi:hypothetical protein